LDFQELLGTGLSLEHFVRLARKMQVFFDLGVGLAFSPSHLQTTPMLGLADVEDVDVKQLSVSEL